MPRLRSTIANALIPFMKRFGRGTLGSLGYLKIFNPSIGETPVAPRIRHHTFPFLLPKALAKFHTLSRN